MGESPNYIIQWLRVGQRGLARRSTEPSFAAARFGVELQNWTAAHVLRRMQSVVHGTAVAA